MALVLRPVSVCLTAMLMGQVPYLLLMSHTVSDNLDLMFIS